MIRRLVPGLAILLAVGLTARWVTVVTGFKSVLIIAIIFGILIGNTVNMPVIAKPGIKTDTLWLNVGIILMGASITLDTIVTAGFRILFVVLVSVILTILLIEILARGLFDIPSKVGSLLAAGSSICGVSAVAVVSGSIKSDSDQVAYAAATVLVFDVITLAVYPVLGNALDLSDIVYGVWAGATMFSTGPVTAAGFSYSNVAGEWAVLVKLTRNALIGLVAIGYALYYNQDHMSTKESNNTTAYIWDTFPKFVLGFLGLMIITNFGLFTPQHIVKLTNASDWLFLFAFAGLGLRIDIGMLRETGVSPAAVVGFTLLMVSALILFTVQLIF